MRNKLIFTSSFIVFLTCAVLTYAFEPASEGETALYNARLVPAPQSVQYGRGIVVFNDRLKCTIVLTQENSEEKLREANELVKQTLLEQFHASPTIDVVASQAFLSSLKNADSSTDQDLLEFAKKLEDPNDLFSRPNGVQILATSDKALASDASPEEILEKRNDSTGALYIASVDVDGVRDAFKTLRQLSETFGVSASAATARQFIPEIKIEDFPTLTFRGLHLCWFPETDPARIEQSIRIAAYYKFNYIVLEFWGTFPFESNPALYWAERHTDKAEVKRLVQLGKSLGVQLIPQINLFGHATGARVAVGKHVALDFNPDLEPLFEPDGWTWNIYNPQTRQTLTECVLELYEAFDSPKFFHIGCDEAYSAGTSFLARRRGDYVDELANWLTYFHDLLQARGCRMMMWHDMLIEQADFKGYVVGGNSVTRGLVDKLPKDVLICDWQYGAPQKDETWPTTEYFQSKGFEFVSCPWKDRAGIKSLANNVIQKKGFGLLCTTWHGFYGDTMRNILIDGSQSAWGTQYRGSGSERTGMFNRHLRQASEKIRSKTYKTGGVNDWQVPLETTGPQA